MDRNPDHARYTNKPRSIKLSSWNTNKLRNLYSHPCPSWPLWTADQCSTAVHLYCNTTVLVYCTVRTQQLYTGASTTTLTPNPQQGNCNHRPARLQLQQTDAVKKTHSQPPVWGVTTQLQSRCAPETQVIPVDLQASCCCGKPRHEMHTDLLTCNADNTRRALLPSVYSSRHA